MSAIQAEIDAWAEAYIAAQSEGGVADARSPHWWAIERFMDLHQLSDAETAWLAIFSVLSRKPSERVLGMLAAGPLEDLIEDWGPAFIDRIEGAARRDYAFRALLRGVWESSTPDVWRRVQVAAGSSPSAA